MTCLGVSYFFDDEDLLWVVLGVNLIGVSGGAVSLSNYPLTSSNYVY